MDIGPIWDTYDLLANAAFYAGNDIGYYDPIRPPVMSILTSSFLHENLYTWPIMLIDGFIFFLGSIGLYLLFRLRFDVLTSLMGALLFTTFPIVLTFATEGLTDLPSVCISIWGLLFTVLAVKKNTRMFYLAFPLFALAFFTRFTSALFIFPVLFYILINRDNIIPKKDILIGIGISFLTVIMGFQFYQVKFGSTMYILGDFFKTSSASVETATSMTLSYNPDIFYYIKLMLFASWFEGIAVFLIIILGSILYFLKMAKKYNFNKCKFILGEKWLQLFENNPKIKLLTIVSGLLICFTIQSIHYIISEIFFFFFLLGVYNFLKTYEIKNMDLDFLFFSWFMVFFIFHSSYILKDFRYVIVMVPPVVYFLIRGFKFSTSQFKIKIRNKNFVHILFSSTLIFFTIISAFFYMPVISETNAHLKAMNENSMVISSWLQNNDPEYRTKVIYSDFWPYTAWHLQMDIGKMPIFLSNQILYNGAKDYNFTEHDMLIYNNVLNDNNVDYYFSRVGALNLTNYKSIKQVGDFILYERVK